jgi:hypothetical protein
MNPPHTVAIPDLTDYLQRYVTDAACIRQRGETVRTRTNKRRIYYTLQYYHNKDHVPTDMRVLQILPRMDWTKIWKNLHSTPIKEAQKAGWYKIIHDLQATNFRLHKIRMTIRDKCVTCGETDTTLHWITECQEGL